MSLMKKKHCFTIQKKRSKLLHHNKLIISHIKQTNIRYSAAHLWFMSWALPDKNYVFIIFQISAHCIYWEERLALEYFPTLLRVKIDFFLCSCYRHLPDVDETACSTICLPEENVWQFSIRPDAWNTSLERLQAIWHQRKITSYLQ